MRFEVIRLSDPMAKHGAPCPFSILESCPKTEVRTCTEEEFNQRYMDEKSGETWRSKGRNHRTLPTKNEWGGAHYGKIARDIGITAHWIIYMKDLHELVNLMNELKDDLILTTSVYPDCAGLIQIVDISL